MCLERSDKMNQPDWFFNWSLALTEPFVSTVQLSFQFELCEYHLVKPEHHLNGITHTPLKSNSFNSSPIVK